MFRTFTRVLAIALGVWLLAVAVLGVGADELSVELRENVAYGTGGGEELTLHLARPTNANEPLPGIVFIHGGGWRGGNKDSLKRVAQQAAGEGYVAVSVGYRLTPKHRFPAQVEDCKCAVRWMRAHAGEIGLDPQRIGAVGFSAGAHLVMMLGTMDSGDGLEGEGGWADQSSKVQAVVSYYGPVDLTLKLDEVRNQPGGEIFDEPSARATLRDFVDGEPEERVEPLRLASPITYVNEGDAPMLLFQGTKDPLVPFQQAFQMAEALSAAKVPGRVELIVGAAHGWGGDELRRTQEQTMAFLRQHLAKAP